MKIKKQYLKTIFVLANIAVFILLGMWIYQIKTHAPVSPSSPNMQTETSVTKKPDADKLPLRTSHKNVANATVFYTIVGKLQTLTDTTVVITSDEEPLPTFTITDKTQYYQAGQGTQSQPINKSAIKTGSNIILTVNYDFSTKQWTVNRVTLNITTAPSSASQ